ncbi:hypothetical protein [Veillonella sp.]|uniref:hypothetical protein n=1 Tax=Veillonella sp. TaxID=1926307 RepID=UPI0025D656E8|nr:hypothetical protein [Veillonella sp.]
MEKVRDVLYGFAFFMIILVIGAIEGAQDESAVPVIAITVLLTVCFVLAAELMRIKINFRDYKRWSRTEINRPLIVKDRYRKAYDQERDID